MNIIEGDCLEVMQKMEAESVDAVITDPPYGMAYQSNYRTATPQFDAIDNDAVFDPEWQLAWMKQCYRLLKNDRHFYAFCNDLHLGEFRSTCAEAGFTVKRTIVWVKDASGMGDLTGDYAHFTEFCVFAHKGTRDLMNGRPSNVIEARRVAPGQMVHPTEKPIRVLRPLITNSTEVGETILDPFAGSGSLGVAAKEENREVVLIEKEKKYVEIIEGRLAQGKLF